MSKPWEMPENSPVMFPSSQLDSTLSPTNPTTTEVTQPLQTTEPQATTALNDTLTNSYGASNAYGGYSSMGGMGYGGMGYGGFGMGMGMGMGYGMGMMNMDQSSSIYKAFRVIESTGFMINCFSQLARSMEQNTEGKQKTFSSNSNT